MSNPRPLPLKLSGSLPISGTPPGEWGEHVPSPVRRGHRCRRPVQRIGVFSMNRRVVVAVSQRRVRRSSQFSASISMVNKMPPRYTPYKSRAGRYRARPG